jgi:hypothetical protein
MEEMNGNCGKKTHMGMVNIGSLSFIEYASWFRS